MTGNDAFLQAIRDNPADDTVRLIYADWLEEHGDAARARFIRLQIDLDRRAPFDPSLPELEGAADELRKGHEAAWGAPPAPESYLDWHFWRGFPAEREV